MLSFPVGLPPSARGEWTRNFYFYLYYIPVFWWHTLTNATRLRRALCLHVELQ